MGGLTYTNLHGASSVEVSALKKKLVRMITVA